MSTAGTGTRRGDRRRHRTSLAPRQAVADELDAARLVFHDTRLHPQQRDEAYQRMRYGYRQLAQLNMDQISDDTQLYGYFMVGLMAGFLLAVLVLVLLS